MRGRLEKIAAEQAIAVTVAVLLGIAIGERRGTYTERAAVLVLLSLVIIGWRFAAAAMRRSVEPRLPALPALLVWAVLAWSAVAGWRDGQLLIYAARPWTVGRAAQVISMVVLASYLPMLVAAHRWRESAWLHHLRFMLLAACTLCAAVAVVRVSPAPKIDVWRMQMEGVRVLLAGKNPFTAVAVGATAMSGPRIVPYIYPPTQILLTLPGYLAGDVRYSMIGGLLLAGSALRAIARRLAPQASSFTHDAPALLLWLQPKLPFIVEQSWTEPLTLGLLLATVAAQMSGRRRIAAVLLGITVAAKQQLVWLAILMPALLGFGIEQLAIAAAVAGGATLPFLLADPAAFKHCIFDYQRLLPPRHDGLTLTVWIERRLGVAVDGALAFLLAAATTLTSILRAQRSAAGLALASAMTYLVFSAFAKWAFANYYFFIIGLCALWAATAARDRTA